VGKSPACSFTKPGQPFKVNDGQYDSNIATAAVTITATK